MLKWFQALMPREERFFDLFNKHAQTLTGGAAALRQLLEGGDGIADACRRIMEFENQADGVAREVLLLTRRSFITPFDRGDIQQLISSLDDSIDQMQKTAKTILLFEVHTFEPEMLQMGDIIVQTTQLVVEAVALMGSVRDQSAKVHALTEEIVRLEDHADGLHDLGIKALFLKHRSGNVMDYIVGIEIFDHLEKVMDRFEDVANRISGIVIEQM
jgi:predicted phosphate transport protein (TIGR00153 family)